MEQQEYDIITRMNEKFMKMSKGHKAVVSTFQTIMIRLCL